MILHIYKYIDIYVYNSVVTCRHIIINSSASAPLNAKKIAVGKIGTLLLYQTAGPIVTKFGTHMQIHLGMDIRQTNCPSRHKGGTWGVLGGQKFKSLGKLSNGWTDWHQLWFTSAYSSGNGHIG